MIKITFIGDLTVDKPLLKASHLGNNKFNFEKVFDRVRPLFQESHCVVGNLETSFGGSSNFLNTEFMMLNTPDEFAIAIKNARIDLVSTANNHALDQNIRGLIRTLDILDLFNISHTGTYRNQEEYGEVLIKTIDGVRFAFIAGTYGINETNIDYKFKENNSFHIDVLKSQKIVFPKTYKGYLKKMIFLLFPPRLIRRVKRFVARKKMKKQGKFLNPLYDTIQKEDFSNAYFDRWINKIKYAKENSDFVFVMPHIGGQFNEMPGPYSSRLIDLLLDLNVNVLANHPHVIQKIVQKKENVAAYSLGGFNMSISGEYIHKDVLPQYSIGIHFYYDGNKFVKSTYTIFIIKEYDDHSLEVFPLEDYYNQLENIKRTELLREINKIHNRIGQRNKGIEKEYDIYL